jgi:uncharacterized protein (DUF433 family)
VPVATVVAKLAGGMSIDEIVAEYDVSVEDVQAATQRDYAMPRGKP